MLYLWQTLQNKSKNISECWGPFTFFRCEVVAVVCPLFLYYADFNKAAEGIFAQFENFSSNLCKAVLFMSLCIPTWLVVSVGCIAVIVLIVLNGQRLFLVRLAQFFTNLFFFLMQKLWIFVQLNHHILEVLGWIDTDLPSCNRVKISYLFKL